MKLKLVSLVPIKEIDVNDPALMRARAARDQMSQIKPNPRIGFDQALDLRGEKKDLELRISNLYREMESDPDIEPEGGPVADQYGDTLNRLETRLYKINKEIASYDMSEGEDEDNEQDMADVKDDIASMMNEATEKSWNSIDVSRKAEKEIGNKEWNERTTKKLDMLIALNKAGKFKKDFDEERLQGWVDQNYSWEKLSRQFKLNESKNSKMKGKLLTERFQELAGIKPLYEADPEAIKGKHYPDDETVKKLKKGPYTPGGQNAHTNEEDLTFEPEDMDNPDEDLVIIGSGYLDIKSNFGERPSQTNGEYAELGQKVVDQLHNGDKEAALDYIFSQINEGSENQTLQVTSYNGTVVLITDPIDIKAFLAGEEVYGEDQDGGSVEVSLDNAQDHQMAEGSCGYGPNGVPGDTPGETKGMPADTRTMTMMRESIRKEIKRLHENK